MLKKKKLDEDKILKLEKYKWKGFIVIAMLGSLAIVFSFIRLYSPFDIKISNSAPHDFIIKMQDVTKVTYSKMKGVPQEYFSGGEHLSTISLLLDVFKVMSSFLLIAWLSIIGFLSYSYSKKYTIPDPAAITATPKKEKRKIKFKKYKWDAIIALLLCVIFIVLSILYLVWERPDGPGIPGRTHT